MKWFRFYGEVLNDAKVQLLPITTRWRWVEFLCLASEANGVLPAISHIAYKTRVSVLDAQQVVDELIMAGLIDIQPDGNLVMHNWAARQYRSDDSAGRVRKHREKKAGSCNGDVTVTVTAPDQTRPETETDHRPDQTRERAKAGLDFGNVTGSEVPAVEPELLRRAEGLGLNAKALEGECYGPKVKNPSAYFQSLCRKRLREQMPGISDDVIGRGLCGDQKAYATLMNILLLAENAR